MEDQITTLAKTLLWSEQVRRENGHIASKQKAQAALIESLKSENQRQANELGVLRAEVASAATSVDNLTTKLEATAAEQKHALEEKEAILQQVVAALNSDGLSQGFEAISSQNKILEAAIVKLGKTMSDVQAMQKKQESQLSIMKQNINELKTSTSKHDDSIWGLDSRLTNFDHEQEELNRKVKVCATSLLQLDKDLPRLTNLAEDAMAAVEALRGARSPQSFAPQAPYSTRDVTPHALLASEAQMPAIDTQYPPLETQEPIPRFTTGRATANSKAMRTERASTVDSQATTQWGDAGPPEIIIPSSPPFVSTEPAHIVREKARRLPAPNFEPRQTRSQARMLAAPITTWSRSLDSQAPLVIGDFTQSDPSWDVPSQSHVSRSVLSYDSRQRTGTTPPPISMPPPALSDTTKKRKLDSGSIVDHDPANRPSSPRATDKARAMLKSQEKQAAPIVEQAPPKRIYKPNRRISFDD